MVKELLITSPFNAVLRLGYFPFSCKLAIITLVHKTGKPFHDASRLESLLPQVLILPRLAGAAPPANFSLNASLNSTEAAVFAILYVLR